MFPPSPPHHHFLLSSAFWITPTNLPHFIVSLPHPRTLFFPIQTIASFLLSLVARLLGLFTQAVSNSSFPTLFNASSSDFSPYHSIKLSSQGHQRALSGQRLQSVLLFYFIPLGWDNRSQPTIPPCWWVRQNSSPVKAEDRGPQQCPLLLTLMLTQTLALKVQTTIWKMLFSLNLYAVITLERWEIVQALFCKTFYVKLYLPVQSCLWASIYWIVQVVTFVYDKESQCNQLIFLIILVLTPSLCTGRKK